MMKHSTLKMTIFFFVTTFVLSAINMSCKKTSTQQTVDNYNAIIAQYFKGTHFTLNNTYYQLYEGGKSYMTDDTTKNSLIKSLAFEIASNDASRCYVYSINQSCDKINPAYLSDSTIKISMNFSVQNFNNAPYGNYVGMNFFDLATAESQGIGSISNGLNQFFVPQVYYKLTNFKFSKLADGTNQLQITLAQPPFTNNMYLDLYLYSK